VVLLRDLKEQTMLSLALGSPPAHVTYCRVHQRAWVASLDRWVVFHVPTRDGSPITDARCDLCSAAHPGEERIASLLAHGTYTLVRS
jgi:hypothetical protein